MEATSTPANGHSPTVVIRPMTEADYPDVARIHQCGLDTGNAAYDHRPDTWEGFTAKRILELCWVATDATTGAILGWVSLQPLFGRPQLAGMLEDSIYIDPTAAGRGVGRALLLHTIAELRATGRAWSIVASIYAENTASRRLHQAVGFREVGTFTRHGIMEYGPWAGQVRAAVFYEFIIDDGVRAAEERWKANASQPGAGHGNIRPSSTTEAAHTQAARTHTESAARTSPQPGAGQNDAEAQR